VSEQQTEPMQRPRRRRRLLSTLPVAVLAWGGLAGLPAVPEGPKAGTVHTEIITLTGPERRADGRGGREHQRPAQRPARGERWLDGTGRGGVRHPSGRLLVARSPRGRDLGARAHRRGLERVGPARVRARGAPRRRRALQRRHDLVRHRRRRCRGGARGCRSAGRPRGPAHPLRRARRPRRSVRQCHRRRERGRSHHLAAHQLHLQGLGHQQPGCANGPITASGGVRWPWSTTPSTPTPTPPPTCPPCWPRSTRSTPAPTAGATPGTTSSSTGSAVPGRADQAASTRRSSAATPPASTPARVGVAFLGQHEPGVSPTAVQPTAGFADRGRPAHRLEARPARTRPHRHHLLHQRRLQQVAGWHGAHPPPRGRPPRRRQHRLPGPTSMKLGPCAPQRRRRRGSGTTTTTHPTTTGPPPPPSWRPSTPPPPGDPAVPRCAAPRAERRRPRPSGPLGWAPPGPRASSSPTSPPRRRPITGSTPSPASTGRTSCATPTTAASRSG
jgi:hypothetical protein